ncbi:hypothetical protein SAMN04488241_10240 [Sphingomonas rubra]|uniref:Helix-turn-helix domain-containing protein n=2 Tax=Sphingomonas rubra TaxID=634430 RepID=A0A1I5QHN5_9SPHN|nr:hypothetical protein SAMN04488241_10240 [Sphingomonas rubra]
MNEDRLEKGAASTLKPLLINIGQLQELLQCGRTKACDLVRTKRVRSMLIGRSRRILLADAERLVADGISEAGTE